MDSCPTDHRGVSVGSRSQSRVILFTVSIRKARLIVDIRKARLTVDIRM